MNLQDYPEFMINYPDSTKLKFFFFVQVKEDQLFFFSIAPSCVTWKLEFGIKYIDRSLEKKNS